MFAQLHIRCLWYINFSLWYCPCRSWSVSNKNDIDFNIRSSQFDFGAKIDVIFVQKVSHYNPANTYTLNIIHEDNTLEQIYTANQTNSANNVELTFPITLPADVKGKVVLQSTYLTVSGTYYSCADLQVGPSSDSTSVIVNFALLALVALAYFL